MSNRVEVARQINIDDGLVIFVTISTSRTVAVLRTFPEIVRSASDTGGCCSASASRRLLTLWSCSASARIASRGMGDTASHFARRDGQACFGENAVNDFFSAIVVLRV